MIRNKIIIIALVVQCLCLQAYGASFHELDEWNAGVRYKRGDVVRLDYSVFVSVFPNKRKAPESSRMWQKVDYNKSQYARIYGLYFPGSIVKHENKFYISKRMSLLLDKQWLEADKLWLEFDHPGQYYALPDTPPEGADNSVVGVDSNENGIRDDFEYRVYFGGFQPEVVNVALLAGRAYQDLTLMSVKSSPSAARSSRLLTRLVLAEMCKREMHKRYPRRAWKESQHFNTIDRVLAKYRYMNHLSNNLGAEQLDMPEGDACVNLQSYPTEGVS